MALSRWRGDDRWTLSFSLDRWRIDGAAVSEVPLSVRRKIAATEKDQWRAPLVHYAVLRLRARVVADSVFGSPQALLEEIVGGDLFWGHTIRVSGSLENGPHYAQILG